MWQQGVDTNMEPVDADTLYKARHLQWPHIFAAPVTACAGHLPLTKTADMQCRILEAAAQLLQLLL